MGEQGEHFPCFPGLVITVCLNIIVLGMNWSQSWCVRCPVVAGDFGPVLWKVKQNISSKKKAKRSHNLFWGLQLSTQAKK